MTKVVFA
jgi:hypothetical protein